VDEQRSYPAEPQPWQAERGHSTPGWNSQGTYLPTEQRSAEEGHRVPEPRGAGAFRIESREPRHGEPFGGRHGEAAIDDPTSTVPTVSPSSGPPGPGSTEGAPRFRTQPIDRDALRRAGARIAASGAAARVGEGFYRTRRPGLAVVLALVVAVFEIPALRILLTATVRDPVSGPGVVAGTFLVLGLPLFGAGLYALASGAAKGPDRGGNPWLRPPLAYLVIALVLFLTAALAAG
jgi:hypothetical protein